MERATQRRRRALVTGCAGFVGSHLSERLIDLGWSVAGVDGFTDYYSRSLKLHNLERLLDEPEFELNELDLSVDPVEELLEGVDTVFHLAAQPGVRGSFGRTFDVYVRHNIVATQRVLEAAVGRGGELQFVYASSSSIYGDAPVMPTPEDAPRHPVSPYGMTKVATEELAGVYARAHGLSTVGLRYFTVYGPRQRPDMAFHRFIGAALAGRAITVLGDGRQMRDFTFVDDAVDATVAAADLPLDGASVYNIGGAQPVVLTRVIELLGDLTGSPVKVERAGQRLGDARHTAADIRLATAALGYEPSVDLESGLAAQVEWMLRARPALADPVVA
jgi:nucleoside-diphosphate-sugar epimerase